MSQTTNKKNIPRQTKAFRTLSEHHWLAAQEEMKELGVDYVNAGWASPLGSQKSWKYQLHKLPSNKAKRVSLCSDGTRHENIVTL